MRFGIARSSRFVHVFRHGNHHPDAIPCIVNIRTFQILLGCTLSLVIVTLRYFFSSPYYIQMPYETLPRRRDPPYSALLLKVSSLFIKGVGCPALLGLGGVSIWPVKPCEAVIGD